MRPFASLDEVTKTTMAALQKAIDSRAFKRYQLPEAASKRADHLRQMSVMFDVLLYFSPAHRSLWHVSNMVPLYTSDKRTCVAFLHDGCHLIVPLKVTFLCRSLTANTLYI